MIFLIKHLQRQLQNFFLVYIDVSKLLCCRIAAHICTFPLVEKEINRDFDHMTLSHTPPSTRHITQDEANVLRAQQDPVTI